MARRKCGRKRQGGSRNSDSTVVCGIAPRSESGLSVEVLFLPGGIVVGIRLSAGRTIDAVVGLYGHTEPFRFSRSPNFGNRGIVARRGYIGHMPDKLTHSRIGQGACRPRSMNVVSEGKAGRWQRTNVAHWAMKKQQSPWPRSALSQFAEHPPESMPSANFASPSGTSPLSSSRKFAMPLPNSSSKVTTHPLPGIIVEKS